MLLSELAVDLTTHLNDNTALWTADAIIVKTELDVMATLNANLGVYIVPIFTDYNLDAAGAAKRGRVTGTTETLLIALIVSKVFTGIPADSTDGVADWAIVKAIIDTRERAEHFIMKFAYDKLTLKVVEPNPIEEAEIDNRNFVALTTFGFEQTSCEGDTELT